MKVDDAPRRWALWVAIAFAVVGAALLLCGVVLDDACLAVLSILPVLAMVGFLVFYLPPGQPE